MNHSVDKSSSAANAEVASIDLSQLAISRKPVGGSVAVPMRRRWLSRYILPLGMLTAFAALFAWAARDSFLPAQVVTITPVVVTTADVQQEGAPLFQAAGWIEPRPTAITVSALAAGVVQDLLVVEGQTVEQGQPIARLIDTDARLAVRQSEASVKLCDADVRQAEAKLQAAKRALETPSELKAALADAESLLAETKLTLGNLPFAIDISRTRLQLAADTLARKEQAGEAIAARVVREAQAEVASAQSALEELQSRGPLLESQVAALSRKRAALAEQLTLMNEQKRAVAEAEANLAAAEARLDQAQLAREVAQLMLERMTIRAPIAGRVLTLDARPGRRLVGLDPSSQQDASAVVTLYDPAQLQVRVDVRLEDVRHVQIGQRVSIETAATAKALAGEVLWITTRADIQKNTLQVKVAINDPSRQITPEMLGQVTFLSQRPAVAVNSGEQQALRIMAPRQLIIGGDGGATIWVADVANGVARNASVQLGRAGDEQLVEIKSGLTPTDKLIVAGRETLAERTRIRIAGEDQTIGAPARVAAGTGRQAK